MEYNNIAHVSYKVRDLEASLRFYCDELGFQRKFTIPNSAFIELLKEQEGTEAQRARLAEIAEKPWLTYLEVRPGQFLELFPAYDDVPALDQSDNHIGYLHLSLEVPDLKAAKAELIEKGVRLITDIALGPDYTYQLWIADPDGNRIELMEYTDRSFQITEGEEACSK